MTNTDIALNVETRNISITEIENEPRARDLDIGKRLGFTRPRAIRDLIKNNMAELETFGAAQHGAKESTSGRGRVQAIEEFWLTEEQALLVSTLSSAPNAPAVRSMLIRAFVAWRRGHHTPASALVLDQATKNAIGGIMKGVVHKQLTSVMPQLVAGYIAEHSLTIADGVTAGEVCGLSAVTTKYPRGVSARVSKRMTQFCAVRNIAVPVTRLGRVRAQIFPTHSAREWLDLEGRSLIKRWVDEKKGQTVLRLIVAE